MSNEYPHVMIDIETLDTRPTALVLSIGAVKFDPRSKDLGTTFYRVLSLEDQVAVGRTRSEATMRWWAAQSADARLVFEAVKDPVAEVLLDFCEWLGPRVEGVWGNGANFDNVIIADLYRSFGLDAPWAFWQDRCYRTAKWLAPQIAMPPREGTYHNALADAAHQARCLQTINAHADWVVR